MTSSRRQVPPVSLTEFLALLEEDNKQLLFSEDTLCHELRLWPDQIGVLITDLQNLRMHLCQGANFLSSVPGKKRAGLRDSLWDEALFRLILETDNFQEYCQSENERKRISLHIALQKSVTTLLDELGQTIEDLQEIHQQEEEHS